MKTHSLLILCLILLSGCASYPPPPSAAEIDSADVGLCPTNYRAQIEQYWQSRLIDPTSPIYEFKEPVKGYSTQAIKGTTLYGWDVEFTLNSKNRLGGYVGARTYSAFFDRYGKLKAMYWIIAGSPGLIDVLN